MCFRGGPHTHPRAGHADHTRRQEVHQVPRPQCCLRVRRDGHLRADRGVEAWLRDHRVHPGTHDRHAGS